MIPVYVVEAIEDFFVIILRLIQGMIFRSLVHCEIRRQIWLPFEGLSNAADSFIQGLFFISFFVVPFMRVSVFPFLFYSMRIILIRG